MKTTFESLPNELILHILTLALNSQSRTIDTTRSLYQLLYSSTLLESFCLINKNYNELTRSILFHSISIRSASSAKRIRDVFKLQIQSKVNDEITGFNECVKEMSFLYTGEMQTQLELVEELLSMCENVEDFKFEASPSSRNQNARISFSIWPIAMNLSRQFGAKPISSLSLSGFILPIGLSYFTNIKTLTLTNTAWVDGWKSSTECFPQVTTLNYGICGNKVDEETRNFLLNMVVQLKILRIDGSRITFSSLPIKFVQELVSLSTSLDELHLSNLERDPLPQSQNSPLPLPILDPFKPLPKIIIAFDQSQFKHPMRSYSSGDFYFSSSNRRGEADVFVETLDTYTREIGKLSSSIRKVSCLSLPSWIELMGNGLGVNTLREAERKLRESGVKVIYETPHPFIRSQAWINLAALRV